MDDITSNKLEVPLYEADELAWLEQQARALRERRIGELDLDNLAEELEGMARSDLNEVGSRLETLIAHVVKLSIQPERYGWSWHNTIREQQRQIKRCLRRSPSLRHHLPDLFAEAYGDAIERAADEMKKRVETVRAVLATRAPLSLDEVLAFDPPELPEQP